MWGAPFSRRARGSRRGAHAGTRLVSRGECLPLRASGASALTSEQVTAIGALHVHSRGGSGMRKWLCVAGTARRARRPRTEVARLLAGHPHLLHGHGSASPHKQVSGPFRLLARAPFQHHQGKYSRGQGNGAGDLLQRLGQLRLRGFDPRRQHDTRTEDLIGSPGPLRQRAAFIRSRRRPAGAARAPPGTPSIPERGSKPSHPSWFRQPSPRRSVGYENSIMPPSCTRGRAHRGDLAVRRRSRRPSTDRGRGRRGPQTGGAAAGRGRTAARVPMVLGPAQEANRDFRTLQGSWPGRRCRHLAGASKLGPER